MTLRQLLAELELQTADGSRAEEEILVLVGNELRQIASTYRDDVFILVAGTPIK